MSEVAVTRGSQVTLTKEIREKIGIEEGDVVTMNVSGDQVIITKKDPEAWETEGFLPEDFEDMIDKARSDSTERLERLVD